MLTQIYEISTEDEARAVCALGIDHVGVLVGDGRFPRELSLDAAMRLAQVISPPAKFSALFLGSDIALIARRAQDLRPAILHLGASTELLTPKDVAGLKTRLPATRIMRSVPVVGEESIAIAQSYDGIADFILLDSHRVGDNQIGALGVTHDWRISRRIVERVRTPVILAGGLGPDNVSDAIDAVAPAGVDSKTRTDRDGSHAKDIDKVRRFREATLS